MMQRRWPDAVADGSVGTGRDTSATEIRRWPCQKNMCSSASTSAPEGHPKGSCLDRGAADVFNALREEQGRRLLTSVKVVATGCMEGCLAGPALLVVPDNVWYGGVTEADVPELVERPPDRRRAGRIAANRSRRLLRLEAARHIIMRYPNLARLVIVTSDGKNPILGSSPELARFLPI